MDFIVNAYEWIIAYSPEVLAVLVALYGLAAVIVKLTETKKDDKILGKIHDIARRFGLDLSKKADK